jgi:general stress protein 26
MRSKLDARFRLAAAALLWLMSGAVALAVDTEISGRDLQALSKSQLIFIATVRKDGNQSKAAPIWFTVDGAAGTILIQTGSTTWKAKRIRRGSPVLVWIGDAKGPSFIGKAEITTNAAVQQKILDDFRKKYWLNRVFGVGPSRADLAAGRQVAIVIRPIRDLPGGFESGPGTPPPPLTMPAGGPGKTP